ncbi:MFS transporter, partial [uncultured Brevundimonas sp.]|uniref:MFS transporter n=1 Tax=uncultured Brevundimonas sp. TaxID=213418 RepID=UPI002613A99D
MSRHTWDLPWHEYLATLKEHERPVMPGSPATPDHTLPYRLAYLLVGVLVAVTGSLGSAMVMANTQLLAGGLGVSLAEASWLPVAFMMTNACMNLLLVKFRMQYGLRLFAQIFLIAFVGISLISIFYSDYQTTLILRGVAGMVSAAMSSLGILYLVQAFPAKHRLKGLVLGMGLTSLGIPFTRVFTSRLLEISEWQGFHTMELGLAILSLVAVFSLRTPPSERMKVYEKLDFLTFALFAPGIALLCAVLAIGRSVWWFDTAWVGWALIGSIVLLATALTIEYNRKRPLINLHFLSGSALIRLFLSVLLVRIVMAEQTAGITGAMQQLGIGLDMMHTMFVVIL